MNELSVNIQRRANALGISMATLCREAKVNRSWFEKFKQRTPKSVEALKKIEDYLDAEDKKRGQS